jgi:hypothetical protein
MEISPVAAVRLMPTPRTKETDLGLTDVYEIERSSRTGDETYTPSGSKAATGGEEDEDQLDEFDDGPLDEFDEPEAEVKPIIAGESQISRFA